MSDNAAILIRRRRATNLSIKRIRVLVDDGCCLELDAELLRRMRQLRKYRTELDALIAEARQKMKVGEGETVMEFPDGLEVVKLYDARSDCQHQSDESNLSGIRCVHCGGWFCF